MKEDAELLRPREVAALFGVRPATIARWAREGCLTPLRTPGGHRRYVRSSVHEARYMHSPVAFSPARHEAIDG
jgi:excisionase family DNA binding protein